MIGSVWIKFSNGGGAEDGRGRISIALNCNLPYIFNAGLHHRCIEFIGHQDCPFFSPPPHNCCQASVPSIKSAVKIALNSPALPIFEFFVIWNHSLGSSLYRRICIKLRRTWGRYCIYWNEYHLLLESVKKEYYRCVSPGIIIYMEPIKSNIEGDKNILLDNQI